MTTREKSQEKAVVRPGALLGFGAGVTVAIAAFAVWRFFAPVADHQRFAQLSRAIFDLTPVNLRLQLLTQAHSMDLPLTTGSAGYWYIARAGGIIAYLLLWLATCWGIMMSSKFIKGLVDVPVAFALHQFLPILGVVFAAVHAMVLLGDEYINFSLWELLIPFASPYRPVWTGLGVLSFYLFIVLIASFSVRKRIGQRTWRTLHYTSYLGFCIVLLHGLMAGSDSQLPVVRTMYLVTGAVAVFLLLYRLLAHAPSARRTPVSRQSAAEAGD